MRKSFSGEEQEVLFQAFIRKISAATDPMQLRVHSVMALRVVLSKPSEKGLLAELTAQIAEIVAEIPANLPPDRLMEEMRYATRHCLRVVQQSVGAGAPAPSGGSHWTEMEEKPPPPVAAARPSTRQAGASKSSAKWWVLGTVIAAGAAAFALLRGGPEDRAALKTESPLTRQILDAANGAVPGQNLFGGTITVEQAGGMPLVTVEGIPPKNCITAGWELARKGTITINGVTPQRVSGAKIAELCDMEDEKSSIIWMPRPAQAKPQPLQPGAR